jgi:DNA (cytosine-5)-methyltransferase 1
LTTEARVRSAKFRNGRAPNPVEFVKDLLLMTPLASEGMGGALGEAVAIQRGNHVQLRDQIKDLEVSRNLALLRTPAASEAERGHQPEDKARARGGQVTLSGQFMNLPTPTVADTFTDKLKSSQQKEGSMHSVNLGQAVHMAWGKFEPAVKRWEEVTGMKAPNPTKPDGKDGGQRLSSEFTEWMMGLKPGWVTGHGLSRKDELKACGNGVVPQQAKLALGILLGRIS